MTANQVSRRSLLKGIGLASGAVAFGGSLAACNSGGTSGGGGGGGATGITIMANDTTAETPLYKVSQAWAAKAGKTIDVQSVAGSDYETKLRTVLASGAPPNVVRVNDDFVKGYYAEGSLLDLKSYVDKDIKADDYYPVAFNFAKQPDGAHAAWPTSTNPGVLYINVDAFEEAGVELPPTDWTKEGWTFDDFLAAAKKLNKPGERYGCLVFPDTSLETIFTVSSGSDGIYSKDGTRFTLAEQPATDALQWVADLALVHKVHPDFATVTAGKNTPNWQASQLGSGKVAMMIGTTGSIPYLRENATTKWDIAPTPMKTQRVTVNTLTVIAIPTDAKDPDLAWDFLKFTASPEGQKIFVDSRAAFPVLKSASAGITADEKGPANVKLVEQVLENAVNENFSEYIAAAREIYRPVLDDVWAGKKTAADALGAIAQKVNDVLAGKG